MTTPMDRGLAQYYLSEYSPDELNAGEVAGYDFYSLAAILNASDTPTTSPLTAPTISNPSIEDAPSVDGTYTQRTGATNTTPAKPAVTWTGVPDAWQWAVPDYLNKYAPEGAVTATLDQDTATKFLSSVLNDYDTLDPTIYSALASDPNIRQLNLGDPNSAAGDIWLAKKGYVRPYDILGDKYYSVGDPTSGNFSLTSLDPTANPMDSANAQLLNKWIRDNTEFTSIDPTKFSALSDDPNIYRTDKAWAVPKGYISASEIGGLPYVKAGDAMYAYDPTKGVYGVNLTRDATPADIDAYPLLSSIASEAELAGKTLYNWFKEGDKIDVNDPQFKAHPEIMFGLYGLPGDVTAEFNYDPRPGGDLVNLSGYSPYWWTGNLETIDQFGRWPGYENSLEFQTMPLFRNMTKITDLNNPSKELGYALPAGLLNQIIGGKGDIFGATKDYELIKPILPDNFAKQLEDHSFYMTVGGKNMIVFPSWKDYLEAFKGTSVAENGGVGGLTVHRAEHKTYGNNSSIPQILGLAASFINPAGAAIGNLIGKGITGQDIGIGDILRVGTNFLPTDLTGGITDTIQSTLGVSKEVAGNIATGLLDAGKTLASGGDIEAALLSGVGAGLGDFAGDWATPYLKNWGFDANALRASDQTIGNLVKDLVVTGGDKAKDITLGGLGSYLGGEARDTVRGLLTDDVSADFGRGATMDTETGIVYDKAGEMLGYYDSEGTFTTMADLLEDGSEGTDNSLFGKGTTIDRETGYAYAEDGRPIGWFDEKGFHSQTEVDQNYGLSPLEVAVGDSTGRIVQQYVASGGKADLVDLLKMEIVPLLAGAAESWLDVDLPDFAVDMASRLVAKGVNKDIAERAAKQAQQDYEYQVKQARQARDAEQKRLAEEAANAAKADAANAKAKADQDARDKAAADERERQRLAKEEARRRKLAKRRSKAIKHSARLAADYSEDEAMPVPVAANTEDEELGDYDYVNGLSPAELAALTAETGMTKQEILAQLATA